ncbi:tRNA (guanine-N(7)-)-methyltransferase non-catalytic subunit wdr4 [Bagarius yarrelli]|uniref:tRNA (Guanine-N(7)-)-methyltransferase non-catalytic subunit wdr4 n=1 Tax=Bagarius yarrelli TaxID=175774 RepID=A0A556U025_BAGYA|nr:tRNA (guanine-N(7)-)-methyltransferase non-catalytic subunit wdr4 [Bagarius yarrelli]
MAAAVAETAPEALVAVAVAAAGFKTSLETSGEPFVFDCTKADPKPQEDGTDKRNFYIPRTYQNSLTKMDAHVCCCFSFRSDGGAQEKGSDQILAIGLSASGRYAALTDDNKRLILFRTQPSWQCISTRWVVRRCTSLVFTQAEDELFVADKSGDVYWFSVPEPQKPGELKLGHLSMLLAAVSGFLWLLSPDDKYIITADRDEKIRVSLRRSPYNIQAFCLGHTEFVSSLCVPAGHPDWLLSGSGDGTVKLWHYESGRRLQSIDLQQLGFSQSSDTNTETLFAVEDGPNGPLTPTQTLALPQTPWDMTFDPQGRLWVLLENEDTNVLLYTQNDERWQRVSETLHTQWELFKECLYFPFVPPTPTPASVSVESRFRYLYKVNFDNMASYLQKKKERLLQQNDEGGKKRAARQSDRAVKKSRTENKSQSVSQKCSDES